MRYAKSRLLVSKITMALLFGSGASVLGQDGVASDFATQFAIAAARTETPQWTERIRQITDAWRADAVRVSSGRRRTPAGTPRGTTEARSSQVRDRSCPAAGVRPGVRPV